MFNSLCKFQKLNLNFAKSFGFLDNCIWIGCGKFFFILREYLSLKISVLTNSHRISDLTKREDYCRADFCSDLTAEVCSETGPL